MSDNKRTELEILVERVVRPLRASAGRKRRIREELLAHVMAVFEEESARSGADQTALERTAERFGDPALLRAQLQESVPATESFDWFIERHWYRPQESTLSCAVRRGILFFLLTLPGMLGGWLSRGYISVWPTEALLHAFLIIGIVVGAFAFTFLAEWTRQALLPVKWRKLVPAVLAASLFMPVMTLAIFLVVFQGNVAEALQVLRWLLPTCVLAPIAVVIVAHWSAAGMRVDRHWASLQLN